jgi:hypothetical protein
MKLADEISNALNRCSAENGSDTPDFILAEFLLDVLAAWNSAVRKREAWHGREPPKELRARHGDGHGG